MMRTFLLTVLLGIFSYSIQAQDVVIQSEIEKQEGLMLKWNYNEPLDSVVTKVASIISGDDKVWIIYDPDHVFSSVQILAQLTSQGANPDNISFIEGVAENPWLRDYGPIAGYYSDNQGNNRHFADPQYDATQYPLADFLPLQLASEFNFNYEALPLNFEGGNLLLDGIGRGFTGDIVLSKNPGLTTNQVIQTLYTKLSLNEITILPSVPECGGGEWSELSRLVKFIDSETVMVSQFPENLPYYQQVESIKDTLQKMYNDVGKQFKVIRLPVVPDENGEYAVTNSGIIRSYTSAIFLNNKILIPSYNHVFDTEALEIYTQEFPGYEIYQVPAQVLAAEHGSLFRLAVNIPQPELYRIRHSKRTGMQPFESEIWINSFVESWVAVDSIQLYYRVHPSTTYLVENTYGCCGGNSGFMSGFTLNDTISYYIKAYSSSHTQTLPLAAPQGVFTFWFDLFTGTEQGNKDQAFSVYPNPARDKIYFKGIETIGSGYNYQLYNITGSKVAEGDIPVTGGIRLPEYLVNGLYIIKIVTFGKTHISKLYLQR
jgi:agmatine deiminase